MAYDSVKPADNQFISAGPSDIRENMRALKDDKIVNAQKLMDYSPGNASGNIPVSNGTVNTNLNADTLDGNHSSAFATSGHTHSAATTSSNGFMANTDKSKLDGIAAGAEVNQNAFANVVVGATTIQADAKSDTLMLEAGANIALTPDAVNDKVNIAFNGTLPIANGGTGATTAAAVLAALGLTATAAELNVLDGILATVAELNFVDGVTSAIQTQLNGKAPTDHSSTGTTYGAASATEYGHAKATTATPNAPGTGNAGTDNGLFARGDHVHPVQTSVSGSSGSCTGNATTATKLATPRTINGVAFDGSANITVDAGLDAASQAQAIAGIDNTVAITPLQLRNGLNASGAAPIFACRAWVNFNGVGTVSIMASGNVSSITDNGVGNYTLNFESALQDEKYGVAAAVGDSGTGTGQLVVWMSGASPAPPALKTTTALQVKHRGSGGYYDISEVNVSIFR